MTRPIQLAPRAPLSMSEIEVASYVGSCEHKVKHWWGGLPCARVGKDGTVRRPKKQHTTICRKTTTTDREEATRWVRAALAAGQLRYYDGDGTYPKHIWYRDDNGQFWFGFAINQTAGTYKGWPVDEADKRATFG